MSVLLAGYSGEWIGEERGKSWAYMRDAKIKSCESTDTYYVSAVDCGEAYNIHPNIKIVVGQRLAGCAK